MEAVSEDIASLVESLAHSDKKVVRAAVDSLVRLGVKKPDVQNILDRFLEEMHSEKRWPVAYALAQIGVPSIPCLDILMEALGSDDADVRWATVVVLSRIGKGNKQIFPRLANLLNTGNSVQKRMAVYCMRYLGLDEKALLPALLQSLRDTDPLVRVATVTTLAEQPNLGDEVLALLRGILSQDNDPRVRNAITFALQRLEASAGKI